MRTGGKSSGIAALASAWCGPMCSARKSVRGGAVRGMRGVRRGLHEDDGAARRDLGRRDGERAELPPAQRARERAPADLALDELGHRASRRRARCPSPPPPSSEARKADDLPHAEAEHARELELASTAGRGGACRARDRRGARRGSSALIAPTLVPHRMSMRGGAPRMRVRSSKMYQRTPTS